MRNRMGSWGFVFSFLGVLIVWVIANSVLRIGGSSGRPGFDPYPYILLNLVLSMLAAIQGAILLIAAKRSDQIASLLAEHDYETDLNAFERIESLQRRLEGIEESNRQLLEQNATILQQLTSMAGPAGRVAPPGEADALGSSTAASASAPDAPHHRP